MKTIKAVVGLLKNNTGKFLISKRRSGKFKSDYWEIPGGKIDPNETPKEAIKRELKEELGINVKRLRFVRSFTHKYPDRIVDLSYFIIGNYEGEPFGAEGQNIEWVDNKDLVKYKLLPSVREIISSLSLPSKYWITPSEGHYTKDWMMQFEQKLAQGVSLIQLRAKISLDEVFIRKIFMKCQESKTKLLLNTTNKTYKEPYSDGWHMTTAEMLSFQSRPCPYEKIIGASTHNLYEAVRASELNLDFIVISPIKPTQTHPKTKPLGWDVAREVVDNITTPVYLLGGMSDLDLDKALTLGAQGIAGVSSF
jgi:8-oxo-dGTP diphosphatase